MKSTSRENVDPPEIWPPVRKHQTCRRTNEVTYINTLYICIMLWRSFKQHLIYQRWSQWHSLSAVDLRLWLTSGALGWITWGGALLFAATMTAKPVVSKTMRCVSSSFDKSSNSCMSHTVPNRYLLPQCIWFCVQVQPVPTIPSRNNWYLAISFHLRRLGVMLAARVPRLLAALKSATREEYWVSCSESKRSFENGIHMLHASMPSLITIAARVIL